MRINSTKTKNTGANIGGNIFRLLRTRIWE